MKRIISITLAILLVAGGLVFPPVPAQAAAGGFTDIPNSSMAQAAELLAALDILYGEGNGKFNPGGQLDRAQLAAIGVRLKGVNDVTAYKNTVKFPDVRAGHWSHGWVMAAVDMGIVVGKPDGTYGPNEALQYQFLVAVLMRLLGYSESDLGYHWPNNYMDKAEALGLTAGLKKYSKSDVLTRGETALLLRNFLFLPMKDGSASYMVSELDVTSSRIVLQTAEVNGELCIWDADGGLTKPLSPISAGQEGRTGRLLSRGQTVLSFLEDDAYTYKTVTVSSAAAGILTLQSGDKLTIGSALPVSVWGGADTSYKNVWQSLYPTEQLLLAYQGGQLQYIYRGNWELRDGSRAVNIILQLTTLGKYTYVQDENGNLYYLEDPKMIDSSLSGRSGRLVVDDEDNVISFTEDKSLTYQRVKVSQAYRTGIIPVTGSTIEVKVTTPVYEWGAGAAGTFGAAWSGMWSGEELLVAYEPNGLVKYVFRDAWELREGARYVSSILHFFTPDYAIDDGGSMYYSLISDINEGKYGRMLINDSDELMQFSVDNTYSYIELHFKFAEELSADLSISSNSITCYGETVMVAPNTPVYFSGSSSSKTYSSVYSSNDFKDAEYVLVAKNNSGNVAYLYVFPRNTP